jgi:hypothetical protein
MTIARYTVVLLVLVATSFAQPSNFDYPCFVTNPEGYITEDNEYLIPTFGDWDDDGDPDMMVGVLYYGNIYYYENVSPTGPPEFSPREMLMADNQAISVGYS